MTSRFSLSGRTALVTGASSGLGAHFAALLGRAGARVVLAARRKARVQELASSLADKGMQALAVELDVTSEDSIRATYDAAETEFGVVDTIIANAGTSASGRSVDVPNEALRNLVDTNFNGVYLTAREGARRLIKADSRRTQQGRVILIGSITAHMTGQGDSAYAATKAAVAHLGRNLAREWVRQGINVNVLQPGYIRTEMSGGIFESDAGQTMINGFHRRRILPMEALDDLTLYLSSDFSHFVTGTVIDIDDGQSL